MITRLPRVLLLAAGLTLPALTARAADPNPKAAAAPAVKLTDLLAKRIKIDPISDVKFGDVVVMLSDRFDLPLVVDPRVGRDLDGAMAACDGADEKPIKLPRLVNVRLSTVLKMVCDQVGATYLVQPEYIKIVPAVVGLYESGILGLGDPPIPGMEDTQLLTRQEILKSLPLIKRALVSASYKKVPLRDVLDDIAESTGATLTLSREAGPQEDVAITIRFANTPVDAAVRTLCEITDLGVIQDANVLIVTTKERAAARAKADAEKRRVKFAEAAAANGLGAGITGIGGGIGFFPEFSADVARLKEQNEQLKAQIEELRKLLKK